MLCTELVVRHCGSSLMTFKFSFAAEFFEGSEASTAHELSGMCEMGVLHMTEVF